MNDRGNEDICKKDIILEVKQISKTFPGVKALKNVDFQLRAGEVMALVGENGAGKSTLMKIICGVYKPDQGSGEILLHGEKRHFATPMDAKKAGIAMIFQEISLVMDLSIAENIYMGSLPRSRGLIDWKSLNQKAAENLATLGYDLDPQTPVRQLSIAQQQMVEVCRGISLGAKILIFDEPTSSLTDKETEVLFENIKSLKRQGIGMVYISHKMDEISRVSDRITVLRDGENSGLFVTESTSIDDVVQSMIGRKINQFYYKSEHRAAKERLRVEKLSSYPSFEDVSFHVSAGEVLGFYGLVGAGRTELVETIFGIRKKTGGKIFIDDKEVSIQSAKDAVKNKLALVPENRKEQGLILGMSCEDNISVAKLPWIATRLKVVSHKKTREIYDEYEKALSISSPGPRQKVVYLSGGNQQKIVIGKWMSLNPEILILDEPTRGIDVGAKAEIYKLIDKLAREGMAIIVISSEMPEILGICDRIITIAGGRFTGEFTREELTEVNLIQGITTY